MQIRDIPKSISFVPFLSKNCSIFSFFNPYPNKKNGKKQRILDKANLLSTSGIYPISNDAIMLNGNMDFGFVI